MKCRYCNAKISDNATKCPNCKKMNPQPEQEAPVSKKRKWIMLGCVVGLAAIAIVLFCLMRGGWSLEDSFAWLQPRENNVYFKNNYSVSDKRAQKEKDTVIATMGDLELTNGQLQAYYWMQIYEFSGNYSDSLSYLGLDLSKNLAKQTYADQMSWQQYFLQYALRTWRTNQAFAELAEKNGYEMPEEYQNFVDNIEAKLEQSATDSGYASVDEMVRAELGAGCSAEDYADYLRAYYQGYTYFRSLYDAIVPTEEEIEAYFAENETDFADSGIAKDDSVYVDLRHILICPVNGTVYSDGSVVYPEDEWNNCLGEAQALVDRWLAAGATEEYFGELASIYSEDQNSTHAGGLYTDLILGDLASALETWSFDESRKAGDWTMIKGAYGYHILYFVDAEEIWHAEARSAVQEQQGQELVDELLKDYVIEVDYEKIVLSKVKVEE